MHTERQKQIIATSMELILSKGIQGFTIKNLSKAIGISEPAIYRHFENKTDILITILDNFIDKAQNLYSNITTDEKPAFEKIEYIFSQIFDLFSKQPSITSIIFSEEIFKNDPNLTERIIDIHNIHQKNIENILSQGQDEKTVRTDADKYNLTLIIIGAVRLMVKRWNHSDRSFNLKQEGRELIKTYELLIFN